MNETRTLVNVAVDGSLMGKNIEDAYKLLEDMVANAYNGLLNVILLKRHLEFMSSMFLKLYLPKLHICPNK